ncbi:MAG: hypothetical protein M1812_000682 [Candelaria pacifica]|nr:MAG: hypothetical protein M1812_000682 [Candelaria pacifica]
MAPQTTKQWVIEGTNGFDSLKLQSSVELPKLGGHDILVNFHAASLNYRDLIIPKGQYPFPTKDGVVPCSDGAGTVVATGDRVIRFKTGDKVVTLFNQSHLAGSLTPPDLSTGLGGALDGTLRQHGVFDESGLVAMPNNLNWQEASTLSCAGLTAWSALYKFDSQSLRPGQTVLTQGTGGVSLFALQFAKAAGAIVISTTSSKEKEDVLKKHGADHVINYKSDPNWGESAKKLTPGVLGVDHIVEVGGPTTMKQSLKAIKIDGVITIIGFLGGAKSEEEPSFLECLTNICTVRGGLVGSRQEFEAMNRAIEANNLKPLVDEKVFGFEEAKEAYQYMWDQKHFGKLTIKID